MGPRRLIVLLLALAASLGAAAPATAADAPAPEDDPAALPARFAEALNQGPAGRACDLLVAELRADFAVSESSGLDPYDAATWSPAGIARGCEDWIHEGVRRHADRGWPYRTTIGAVRVVAQRGGVAHLRVRVEKHLPRSRWRGDLEVLSQNVFAERDDDGTWRLTYVGRLLDEYEHTEAFTFLGPDERIDLIVPRTLRDHAAFRRQQRRLARFRLAERRRGARAFAAARTRIGAQPRACRGFRVPGRSSSRARGIRAATLRLEPRSLCWTLLLAGPLPARLGLEAETEQRARAVVRRRQARLVGYGADFHVQLRDGTAAGWVSGGSRQTFTRVRTSARGRTLVVRVPFGALNGRLEPRRPFRWRLTTFPVGAALDELPAPAPPA